MHETIGKEEVSHWLHAYKTAWEDQDPNQIVALFAPEAEYVENPFEPPMQGHEAIRAYWTDGALNAQSDIMFRSTLWHVENRVALAHWTAELTRNATGKRLNLDGVFRLTFALQTDGSVLCTKLQEWWFRDGG